MQAFFLCVYVCMRGVYVHVCVCVCPLVATTEADIVRLFDPVLPVCHHHLLFIILCSSSFVHQSSSILSFHLFDYSSLHLFYFVVYVCTVITSTLIRL